MKSHEFALNMETMSEHLFRDEETKLTQMTALRNKSSSQRPFSFGFACQEKGKVNMLSLKQLSIPGFILTFYICS